MRRLIIVLGIVGLSAGVGAFFGFEPGTSATPTPTPATVVCPDFDGDGLITVRDLQEVAWRMGSATGDRGYDPAFDLNADGRIDSTDLRLLREHFGEVCP